MDYEKEYKEALQRAKNLHKDAIDMGENLLAKQCEIIFHELKENKEEKIKERILLSLEKDLLTAKNSGCNTKDLEECIAWLEEQGTERKQLYIRFGDIPSNEKSKIYSGEEEIGYENGISVYPAFELNGNVVLGLTLPITKTTLYTQQQFLDYDDRPCYLVSGDYVGKGTDGEPLIRNVSIIKRLDNYRIKELEKQGESKFEQCIQEGDKLVTNKDGTHFNVSQLERVAKKEPKFKVGDWVIDKQGIVHQIANVIENVTYHTYAYDIVGGGYFNDNTEDIRLWTIQDAKDGDVLAFDNDNIVIFKDLYNHTSFHSYCHIEDGIFDFSTDELPDWWEGEGFNPATKEQHDILFAKMKEAGYEWNAEKKEVKKIEIITPIFNVGDTIIKKHNSDINDFGQFTITDITGGKYWYNDRIICDIREQDEWEFYEPVRQNSAWSEEDEKMCNSSIRACQYMVEHFENSTKDYEDSIDWLKSLKDRVQPYWKPSDEQMQVLIWCLPLFADPKSKKILKSLIDDLKNNPYRD